MKTRTIDSVVKQFKSLREENPNMELCPVCYWIVTPDEEGIKMCPNLACELDEELG